VECVQDRGAASIEPKFEIPSGHVEPVRMIEFRSSARCQPALILDSDARRFRSAFYLRGSVGKVLRRIAP